MSDNTGPTLDTNTLLAMTTQIVSAYAGNAKLTPTELSETIGAVLRTLTQISATSVEPQAKELAPAVTIKKSVTPDFIICLEDGKKLRMLKRHLMSMYNLTPAQYREKWNLPRDYPMVAPNYAAARSALAKKSGLGRPVTSATKPVTKTEAAVTPTVKKPAVRRARPAKKAVA